MIVDVQVPMQGLTVTEATLLRWAKQPGETVAEGETLFEIETDKAAQEIESPAAGTVLDHLARETEVVKLGAIIGHIGTDASDTVSAAPAPPQPAVEAGAGVPPSRTPAASSQPGPGESQQSMAISPRARRAAERLGVDLATVVPTGARGRHVRERDVLAAHAALAVAVSPQRAADRAAPALSRYQRVSAERTAASFREAPHFYLTREVAADRLVEVRGDLVSDPGVCGDVRVTITDLLLRALALALRDHPAVNAQWQDGRIEPLDSVDVSLAVDTPNGLVVPVIRGADTLSLCQLAQRRKKLAELARTGKLALDDVVGGSFTLTNLGQLDVDQFQAVINPPQSGILATGTIKARPFVADGGLVVRQTLVLTLSMDHRVVDGAGAARFLGRLVQLIEHPALLCVP